MIHYHPFQGAVARLFVPSSPVWLLSFKGDFTLYMSLSFLRVFSDFPSSAKRKKIPMSLEVPEWKSCADHVAAKRLKIDCASTTNPEKIKLCAIRDSFDAVLSLCTLPEKSHEHGGKKLPCHAIEFSR